MSNVAMMPFSIDSCRASLPVLTAAAGVGLFTGKQPAPSMKAKPVFTSESYREIETTVNAADRALWCRMRPSSSRPSFTPALLADLAQMQRAIRQQFLVDPAKRPFEFMVFASRTPEVFSLGGDLELFHELIERRDYSALRRYAHRCVEVIFANYIGYGNRVVTIALVQGEALGGGFEAALSTDYIVAERQAKFGFPEVLFNLFPGMGAYSFLSRRIGVAKTEEMLRTGKMYSARELFELGVIDEVVDEGTGELAVRRTMERMRSRLNANAALYQVRRRVDPVTLEELKDVADIWVESALRLDGQDLRRMKKITGAQEKARQRRAVQIDSKVERLMETAIPA